MPSDNRRLLPLWEQHWWTTLWMVRTMVRILSWRTSIHNLRVQFISSNPAFCRFHGDAITAKNCTACSCDQCGSTVCDNRAGNCECKPNVEGSNCDRCMVRFVLVVLRTHTKIVFLGGSLGIFSLFWMSSMSLRRRLIFHSMWWRNWPMLMPTRSRRLALWALWTRFLELWRVWMSEWVEISVVSEFLFFLEKIFLSFAPLECDCEADLSMGTVCDVRTGQCHCQEGATGARCDQCLQSYLRIPTYGCRRRWFLIHFDVDFPVF